MDSVLLYLRGHLTRLDLRTGKVATLPRRLWRTGGEVFC